MAEPILSVVGLTKAFSVAVPRRGDMRRGRASLLAVDNVELEIHEREVLGLVGESGSGKSTVARCLVRLHEPDRGSVRFRGAEVLNAGSRELGDLRRRMQLVYQDPYSSLNPRLTIGAAIAEPAIVHGLLDDMDAASFVRNSLEQVGISPLLADRRPHALSGGQRQRVAIARAMATRPELMIADEAVSALDVSVQAQILALLARVRDDAGLAMLFISHQLTVVARISDRVAVMYLGRIVEEGPTAEVFAAPAHPYTAALLAAQPGRHRRGRTRPALSGEIPSPLDIPTGCRFRTRCPLAQDVCASVDPTAVTVHDGHRAWCHFTERVRNELPPAAALPA